MTWKDLVDLVIPRFRRTPRRSSRKRAFTPAMSWLTPSFWRKAKSTSKTRAFTAAETGNLVAGWKTHPTSINADLRASLRTMVARARHAEQNNDYAKKFINMMAANVVGPGGIKMQSKIRFSSGNLMKRSNKVIENGWNTWAKRVDAAGKLSWMAFLRQVVKTVARDGEVLIQLVRNFNNPWGFAVHVMETDRLDVDHNEVFRDGRRIVMGVELDVWDHPIAYHILTAHPGDSFIATAALRHSVRVPAEEILHVFLQDRPGQIRGIPWMHTALWRFNMLNGYEEGEMVAARLAASKMGFFTSENGEPVTADSIDKDQLTFDVEPGQFRPLPPGVKFDAWNPDHPNAIYKDFMKVGLRGASSGLLVSYNSLANDLEGVNFSSIRQGALDERDIYRMIQGAVIDQVCRPLGEAWVTMQSLLQTVPIPPENLDRVIEGMSWQPRGWPWVDPLKDTQANVLSRQEKLISRRRILAAQGIDFEDVLDELEEEEDMIDERGLNEEPDTPGKPMVTEQEPDEETVP